MLLSRFLLLILILSSCETTQYDQKQWITYTIYGRDDGIPSNAEPIYRVKAPSSWRLVSTPLSASLVDTTKPLSEWTIEDPDGLIRITVHNFPTDKIEQRIPPSAQIARWQGQFEQLDPLHTIIKPVAFSGFSGLFFEGSGLFKKQPASVLAWIMQIAQEHYQTLSHAKPSDKATQQRADFSIKIIGPRESMEKHKKNLIAFAHSFELIEEIPSRR